MKKLILTAALFATLSTFAGNGDHGDKYCAKMKDGKMWVMHKGSAITADVALDNGGTLKADGTVTMKDGTSMMLKDGECVHKDGTMGDHKDKDMKK